MKVIFLDIDGVLNSSRYRSQLGSGYLSRIIDRRKMPLLKQIVAQTDAQIVLSSSWRKFWNPGPVQFDPAGAYFSDLFREYGLRIYGKTPVLHEGGRGDEIQTWLNQNPCIDGYVILDDKDFGYSYALRAHFIRTDTEGDGLEESQVAQAVDVLRGKLLPVELPDSPLKAFIKRWTRKIFPGT